METQRRKQKSPSPLVKHCQSLASAQYRKKAGATPVQAPIDSLPQSVWTVSRYVNNPLLLHTWAMSTSFSLLCYQNPGMNTDHFFLPFLQHEMQGFICQTTPSSYTTVPPACLSLLTFEPSRPGLPGNPFRPG